MSTHLPRRRWKPTPSQANFRSRRRHAFSRLLSSTYGRVMIYATAAVLISIGIAFKDWVVTQKGPSTPGVVAPPGSSTPYPGTVQVVRPPGLQRPAPQQSSYSHPIEIIDGDTIRSAGYVYRLVGFDTPETGRNARCAREQTLGAAATRRLTELVRGGGHVLARVPCACVAGHRRDKRLQLRAAVRSADGAGPRCRLDSNRRRTCTSLHMRRHKLSTAGGLVLISPLPIRSTCG
jgi:hypothetical protein